MDQYYSDFLQRGWVPNFDNHPQHLHSLLEMVIVEPRNHECLAGALSNMSALLPNAALTIIHSKENEELIQSIVKPSNANNHVRMIPTFAGNIDRDAYSKLLMTPEFWKTLSAPKTLIFQTDTAMRYNGILRFMEYDYIGAPWLGPVCNNPQVRIGNGGFSLRSRAFMEDIVHKHPYQRVYPNAVYPPPEDVYFGNHIHLYNDARIPSIEDAAWFSLEYIRHSNPMGSHKAWTFDAHPKEYIQSVMTSNIASPKPITQVKVVDAWIEDETGHINYTYNLKKWLSLGISTDGLFAPQGTLLTCIEKDTFPGYKKYLKIHAKLDDDESRLYTVRLHHNRISEDLRICK